jgi:fibronectin-binding autotransporter adhesin
MALSAAPAQAACSTTSVGSGSWLVNTTWNNGVPSSGSNTCIDNSSVINLTGSGATNTLNLVDGTDSLNVSSGSNLAVAGAITNGGSITIGGNLELTGNVSLSGTNSSGAGGPGTLTLEAGSTVSTNCNNCNTLTNNSGSTIQGAGTVGAGSPGPQVNFNNAGTVNANSSGNALTFSNGQTMSNTGVFEATGGGILDLQNSVNNVGGNITANGGTVSLTGITVSGGTLNVLGSGVMQTVGSAGLDGTPAGGLTLSNGSTYTAGATTRTDVAGNIILGTSGAGSNLALAGDLRLTGNTTLSGPGTLTLASGSVISTNCNNCNSLTNSAGTTIQGAGTIGASGLAGSGPQIALTNHGVVNANSTGNTLAIAGGIGTTNTNLLEAANGGTLDLQNNVNNVGGNITANGGTVNLDGMTVSGGTLNVLGGGTMQTIGFAGLDGTPAGGLTLSDGSTYTAAATTRTDVNGNIILGTTTGSNLALAGDLRIVGNTTLSGPGTLTMAAGSVISTNCNNCNTLTNSAGTTIQGAGTIGASGLAGSGPQVILNNQGVVNANSTGNTLTIAGGIGVTNTNLLEATNGGTLDLQNNVNNVGGNITANGGTVQLDGMTVSGGTLNVLGGGTMETIGSAGLDGTPAGGLILSNGSTYTAGAGTRTDVNGNIILGTSGAGSNLALAGDLRLFGNTTLSGPGTLTMAAGSVISTSCNNCNTLINSAGTTIQGAGTIGASGLAASGPQVILNNQGVVNANSSGNTLAIAGGINVTNTNLLEATNGGTLDLQNNVTNSGGNITANGGTVNLDGMTVSGGTLNVLGGGTMQTIGSAGLDGTPTGGLTLSNGSTYTAGAGTRTDVNGNIILGTSGAGSNIALSGEMRIVGNTTLSGPGTLTMATGSIISTTCNNCNTLTNNATIQGAGTIGAGSQSGGSQVVLTNGATGVLSANVNGQKLEETYTLTNYNGGNNTLTGGTYKAANGGALQLDALGNGTGGEIHTNNATIILNGAASKITDANGNNALVSLNGSQGLNNNQGTLVLENGASLQAPSGTFNNSGEVLIGQNSALTVSGGNEYLQTGGETQVDGTINANLVEIQGGVLAGGNSTTPGSITGSVLNDCNANTCGTVQAGNNLNLPVDPPGNLSIGGDYTQDSGAALIVDIGGAAPSQTSQVQVGGNVNLNGVDDILTVSLLNSFVPAVSEDFLFMTYGGTLNADNFQLSNANVDPNGMFTVDYSHSGEIYLDFTATNAAATPEPSFIYPAIGILAGLLAYRRMRNNRESKPVA